MSKPRPLLTGALFLLLAGGLAPMLPACSKKSAFGSNATPTPTLPPVDTNNFDPNKGIDPRTLEGTLKSECGMTSLDFSKSKGTSLLIPLSCISERTEPADPINGLDLVFVLDTTGSMGPYVSTVRSSIQQIKTDLVGAGWKLRIGALSFGDVLYDQIPLSDKLDEVFAAMDPKGHPESWDSPNSKGGDDPEQGVMALQCGLELLGGSLKCQDTDAVQAQKAPIRKKEKVLLYVSDAPARNRAGQFESKPAEDALRLMAKETGDQGASFRYYFAVGQNRGLSWPEQWPTPRSQMAEIHKRSGAIGSSLSFPFDGDQFKKTFVDDLKNPRIYRTSCILKSSLIMRADGSDSGISHESIDSYWKHDVKSLGHGNFKLKLERECGAGEQKIEEIPLVL